jgi:hypothetical protein
MRMQHTLLPLALYLCLKVNGKATGRMNAVVALVERFANEKEVQIMAKSNP